MSDTIKISDIAEKLGISRNTVSKALNGKYVPEKTKIAAERVKNAILSLNK